MSQIINGKEMYKAAYLDNTGILHCNLANVGEPPKLDFETYFEKFIEVADNVPTFSGFFSTIVNGSNEVVSVYSPTEAYIGTRKNIIKSYKDIDDLAKDFPIVAGVYRRLLEM